MMLHKLLFRSRSCCCPRFAGAADITGVPKIRDGDQVVIGNSRIELGGIDAPSSDQLCLNNKGERWTCGVAARDELIRHVSNDTVDMPYPPDRPPRPDGGQVRGRWRGRSEMDGEKRMGAGLCALLP